MSTSGIASSIANLYQATSLQNMFQQMQSEFQQLGQNLQSGNLTNAQEDFATLTQNSSQQTGQTSSISQAFNTLGQDLQSGNLAAAQQTFSTIQQDLQNSGQIQHHHHHGGGGHGSASAQQNNSISQAFSTLGQDLQSANLSAAQQAFSTIQQDLQDFGGSFSSGGTGSQAAGTINVSV